MERAEEEPTVVGAGSPTAAHVAQRSRDANGFTLPAGDFTSPSMFELELDVVFGDSWQYVGPASKVVSPGDHFVSTVGRTPIVVTRGRDGDLNGLVNVCRHRLHPVAVEDGSSGMLQCRYHGWSYKLDGRLNNAPRCRDELEIDKAEHGLPTVKVEVIGPWVFANLHTSPEPLHDMLSDCADFIDEMVGGTARFTYQEQMRLPIQANWKLFVENAIECYHCPLIHAESFAKAFKVNAYEYESHIHQHANTQYGPAKLVPEMPSGREPNGFQFLFLPPNSLLAIDDFTMAVLKIQPTGPTTCELVADLHVDLAMPEAAREEWVSVYLDQTLAEDIEAVERQQIGFASGAVPHGRLLSESENALRWFEAWVATRTRPTS